MNRAIPIAVFVIIGLLAFLFLENSKQQELIYGLQQRLEEVDYERRFKDNLKEEVESRKKQQEFLLQRDYEKQFEEKVVNRLEELVELEKQDIIQLRESLDTAVSETGRQLREYAVSVDELKDQLKYYSDRGAQDIKKLEGFVQEKLSETGQLLSRRAEEIDILRQEVEKQSSSLNETIKDYNELLDQVMALESRQPEPAKGQQE